MKKLIDVFKWSVEKAYNFLKTVIRLLWIMLIAIAGFCASMVSLRLIFVQFTISAWLIGKFVVERLTAIFDKNKRN